MKALITGINGFAGSFLAERLLSEGNIEVHGTILPGTGTENLSEIEKQLIVTPCDLLDQAGMTKLITSTDFDYIFHLAGASGVKEALDNPAPAIKVNVLGSLNLLQPLREKKSKARVVVVTSGNIYGKNLNADTLVNEETPLEPTNPYGVSKAALDMLAQSYAQNYGLAVIIARPFNHTGPRHTPNFFVPNTARQIAAIVKNGLAPEIELGNLKLYRDFTDVRDVAEAYLLLAQKGKTGQAYNICSGREYYLQKIVEDLGALACIKLTVKTNPAALRKNDITRVRIDASKITRETGWQARVPFETTLKDTLNYWLKNGKTVS